MRWLTKIDPSVQKISGWFTFIAGVGAFLSWVASHFLPLSPYGWGAFVFAGLAAACVLSLVISVGLIAWRFFNPLSSTTVPIETSGSAPWKADIESMGRAVEQYIDATSDKLNNNLANALKAAPWKADIDRQAAAQAVISAGLGQLDRKFGFFIKAIRAGDAKRDVLVPNDKIAMALGKRLAEAKAADYPDPRAWFSDHQQWQTALRAIDRLVANWASAERYDGYAPFFNPEPRHFQHSPMPPENIRIDDMIIPFKMVWYAESSYARQRDGIFAFFDTMAALPG